MSQERNRPKWLKSLPNNLTAVRIFCIPILLLLYPLNFSFFNYLCTVIFALAALTDFFDGYIARRFQVSSRFGAVIDPMADKLLVASAIILLTNAHQLPAFLAGLLICRELAVSGIRLTAMEQNITLDVDNFGKFKTLVQDFAIVCLMPKFEWSHNVGIIAMWVAILIAYYSGYRYWMLYWSLQDTTPQK